MNPVAATAERSLQVDLSFAPDEEAFRDEVRGFYAESLPASLADRMRLGGGMTIERARSAVINGAAALDGPATTRERIPSAAKYTIGRTGTLVAEEAIQLHGGIGMTWEPPMTHYAKRLMMIDHQLGEENYHLAGYAAPSGAA
jgi:hypothetical protein